MAKRLLHSSFWGDLEVGTLSKTARLLFLGMMNFADDEGRLEADPRQLRARIFPYDEDESVRSVAEALDEILAACASVIRYEANGRQYVAFLKWETYQILKNSKPSTFPAPPVPSKPVEGKPGPKRRTESEAATDNLPIVSRPVSNELPIDCQSTANQIQTESENGSGTAPNRTEVEEKRREEKTTHYVRSATAVAPPGRFDGKPEPIAPPLVLVGGAGEEESPPSKRPGADLYRDVFGRFPKREYFHRLDAAIASKGAPLVRRRLEEWRDNPACSPTNYEGMLDVVVSGWRADRTQPGQPAAVVPGSREDLLSRVRP